MASSDSNTCTFPGCARPVPRPSSPGRPPQYCDLPEHTRWRAWKERQRLAQEAERASAEHTGEDADEPDPPTHPGGQGEPVTAARLRADDLLTRFAVQSEQLEATLRGATEAFATMTDPGAAEAQVESARVEGARRVAEADAARLEAENRRREAETARRRAEKAAAAAVEATQEAERIAQEAVDRRDGAESERDRYAREHQRAVAERDAAVAEANAGLAAAERRLAEQSERARAELAHERSESERRAALARDEIAQLRREHDEHVLRADEAERSEQQARDRSERAEENARAAERTLAEERTRLGTELERARDRHESEAAAAAAERERLMAEVGRLTGERDRLAGELDKQRHSAEITLSESREAAAARLSLVRQERDRAVERAERAEAELGHARTHADENTDDQER
ncbi:hypothetical protein GCM10007147_06510 [Nocardiopsis kunsanensis]|uniref:Chromosome segregation ATPase n=1 Tax=Nocardiopsis kunsanensis TaxID=141693 RepID=A0A918X8G3_9ACTN|nr:hypothetical protein [Nocardiopsis kunsanensis]GHD17405.1 hypothetical protein GCM10007147_06510 [Nocardiopsis kunsanensis]